MNKVLVCLSLSEEELGRLSQEGPRRDIVLLAQELGAPLLLRRSGGGRRGLRQKLFGPQIRHAWDASGARGRPETIFADGEHLGFPLAAMLFLRRRRATRLVILGHLVDKRWKKPMLWLASRLVPRGTLVLHSNAQVAAVQGLLPGGWGLRLEPYQADQEFWTAGNPDAVEPGLVVAVGAENRDYQTLVEAARGLNVRVKIAAGSHWARLEASADDLPENVEFIRETLSFTELRVLYRRAQVVAVPLFEGSNQAGVTTILEAMSMAKPVIVSGTRGQQEVVRGAVIDSQGIERDSESQRGPAIFGFPAGGPAGLYVAPGDPVALRAAISRLASDPERCRELGEAGRRAVERHFSVDAFARRFAAIVEGDTNLSTEASKLAATAT